MKFCQFQFVFALDYFVGRFGCDNYKVGQVLCEEPFVCMFKMALEPLDDSVPYDIIVTFVVENNGEYRYITGDYMNFDEQLNKAFVELGVKDTCGGHDDVCFADSPSYYLDAWPLRTMTWLEVQGRRYKW
jgi:hypothetical protein